MTPMVEVYPAVADIRRVVVVGAALAGMRTVQALRRQGYAGTITLVGAEPHVPYDRPPLSKQYLAGDLDLEEIAICGTDAIERLDVELVLGVAASGLDLAAREVNLAGGGRLSFDRLVVATGAAPVVPAIFRSYAGITGFRTVEDATLLRDRLAAGDRVVVVGGGFIGAEIASTARQSGYDITLVEALEQPLQRVLGAEIGAVLAAMHVERGVTLHTGAAVTEVTGSERVEGLLLADGRRIECDHVVVSVGVHPGTGWLAGSGLDLRDGVRCDGVGRAAGSGGLVYAVGDVASWHHERYGQHLRVEHWTSAVEMAPVVARDLMGITGAAAAQPELPYFWSDQCGTKIQLIGRVKADDQVHVVVGSIASGRFVALYRTGDRVSAALSFGMPRDLMRIRPAIEADRPWSEIVGEIDDRAASGRLTR
jgi:NADPH-dependent 2,4-dienoyl-CoA reductase/sulfur reductase-like enzyme